MKTIFDAEYLENLYYWDHILNVINFLIRPCAEEDMYVVLAKFKAISVSFCKIALKLFFATSAKWHFTVSYIIYSQFYFVFFIILVLLFSLVIKYYKKVYYFNFLCYFVIFGLSIYIFILIYLLTQELLTYKLFWDEQFSTSKFILFAQILICIISICVFISMVDYFNDENFISFELPILMLLCLQGMFLLISSNDLFITYLAIELQSLSLYILASLKRYSNLSIEAGLKYFILGSFASGLLLYGISLVYGFVGSTNYNNIYIFLWTTSLSNDFSLGIIIGFIFILSGLFFKLGIAPFHYWIADVYEGSSTIITYFFSVLPKISIFISLIRIFFFLFNPNYLLANFSYVILFVSICCALFSVLLVQWVLYIRLK